MKQFDVVHTKRSRRRRRCDWCSEWIELDQPKVSWFAVDGGDRFVTKVHPECYEAIPPNLEEFPGYRQPRGGYREESE